MKILPLVGYKSFRALNAFHVLLLGLKMIPLYAELSYERFFEDFKDRPEEEKEKLIRQAAVLVELKQDEVEALLSFSTDKNGVPISAENVKNLDPGQIHEAIVAVCMQIGRIKVDLVTEDEKKKFQDSASIFDRSS